MHVLVTGATGFIGPRLIKRLLARHDTVSAFTRDAAAAQRAWPDVRWHAWTPQAPGAWQSHVDGVDAVVHLAGKGIFDDRWSDAVRQELRDSRVKTTRLLVDAIAQAAQPPRVLVSGSAVGYYGDRADPIDEDAPPGDDFLARLCVDWEAEAARAAQLDRPSRVVQLRTGIVFGQGGALEQIARPFKMFVGGPVGSGEQYTAWIHAEDLCGMILFALDHEAAAGPMNGTAPTPVTMNDLARAIGEVLHRPAAFRVPAFALKLAAGEVAEVLLGGQNALPRRAQAWGYAFRFPDLREALEDILLRGGG